MEVTVAAQWGEVLEDIRREVGDTRFNLWFRNTVAVAQRDDVLDVGTPSSFLAEWLETHYQALMARAAARRAGKPVTLRFVVDPALFQDKCRTETRAKQELLEEVAPPEPARAEAARYTLSNFVVGPCNAIAYAAALKVVESPGTAYNPLFIHGGVGLGKTHLLIAAANAVKAHNQRAKVEYVSGEGFTNRFLFALRNGALDAFRARYRSAGVLVIDDVHFLANKPATQDEFLNTFNALSRSGGQVIMASDSHPKLIGKFKEGLINRFVSGMVAQLEKPDYETRLEIVRAKAAQRHLRLEQDVADFVARRAQASVREIEGAVNTLAACANLSGAQVTVNVAAAALKGLVEGKSRPVSLPDIDVVVSAYAGLAEGELRSARRTHAVSSARHLAMYIARHLGTFSYTEIGTYFGKRNHSSVVSAVEKVARRAAEDDQTARTVASLSAEFGF